MLRYLYLSKRGNFMTNFIADNWIAIVGVLLAIVVGLVVALVIMDRRDKKLIAEYKASLKAAKTEPTPVEEKVEEVEPVVEEAEEVEKPVKKTETTKKTTTTKKAPAKSTTKKTTGTKSTKKSK